MAKTNLHLRLFRMSQKVTLCLILCIAMITADRSVKVLLQDLEKFIEFWRKLSSDLIKNAADVSKIYRTLKERFISLKTNGMSECVSESLRNTCKDVECC
ncbi:hypothetical protein D915_007841 [Fasciola hepatica]|uniref:Uncharacterized protein n=1 Tax=Fasciola hepatica TaxID=6192 RepID=A0A4E0R0S0_FASHE|nr:hypothetical protein D915_007841 [Fasciola hepatica]